MKIINKLTAWLIIFNFQGAVFAQAPVKIISIEKKAFNLFPHGRIKTGVLSSDLSDFQFNANGYSSYGVSSFKVRYYNCTLKKERLNIFVGVRNVDSTIEMIPDLNFDNNFNNDTVLSFVNTHSLSIDSINSLAAALQPFKLPLSLLGDCGSGGNNYLYITLTPRTYFSYAKKHPPVRKQDSLYVNAQVSEHYEGNFTFKKQDYTILIEDVSLDTVYNAIGIGNPGNAVGKIISANEQNTRVNLFVPLKNERLYYNNDAFTVKVIDKYKKLSMQENIGKRPLAGVLPGMQPERFYGRDVVSRKKYYYLGKETYTLLFFWFVGCGPCHEVMPKINLFSKENSGRVRTLSICTAGQLKEINRDIDSFGIKYPVLGNYTDVGFSIAELYKIQEYPTFMLLSKTGKILCRTSVFNEIADFLKKM